MAYSFQLSLNFSTMYASPWPGMSLSFCIWSMRSFCPKFSSEAYSLCRNFQVWGAGVSISKGLDFWIWPFWCSSWACQDTQQTSTVWTHKWVLARLLERQSHSLRVLYLLRTHGVQTIDTRSWSGIWTHSSFIHLRESDWNTILWNEQYHVFPMDLTWGLFCGVLAAVFALSKQRYILAGHTVGPWTHKPQLGFRHASMHSWPSMPTQLGWLRVLVLGTMKSNMNIISDSLGGLLI